MHPTPCAERRSRSDALLAALLGVAFLLPAAQAGPAPVPEDGLVSDPGAGCDKPGAAADSAAGPGEARARELLRACQAACRELVTLHARVEHQRLDPRAAEPYAPRLGRLRFEHRAGEVPRLSVIAEVEPLDADALGWAYHLVADGDSVAALDSRGPWLRQSPLDAAAPLFAPVDGLLPALLLDGSLGGDSTRTPEAREGEAAGTREGEAARAAPDGEAACEPDATPVTQRDGTPGSIRLLGLSVVHGVRCDVLEIHQADDSRTRLHVAGVDRLPRRIERLAPDGSERITVLWDVRPGVPLGDRDFALPVPPGVEVLGASAAPGD